MRAQWISRIRRGIGASCAAFLFAAVVMASDRVTIPEGNVIELQTTTPLDSRTARQGDTFSTTVLHSVYVGGNLAIPQASSVDGRVTEVRSAARGSQSGVIDVEFFRLVLADGASYDVSGVLTTRNQEENGQNGNSWQGGTTGRRIVLIGGRRGTIIGELPDNTNGTISDSISALLSSGSEAQLPSGSNIAMRLVSALTIAADGPQAQYPGGRTNRTDYTSPRMVRRAQTELYNRKFYNGLIDGQLNPQTRQALTNFQRQNGLQVTGDLNQQTAARLGLIGRGPGSESTDRQLEIGRAHV